MRMIKLLRGLILAGVGILASASIYGNLDLIVLNEKRTTDSSGLVVELVVLNRGNLPATSPLAEAESISATLQQAGEPKQRVTLRALSKTQEQVQPGAFASRHYQLTVPSKLKAGQVILELEWQGKGLATLIEIPRQTAREATPAIVTTTPVESAETASGSATTLIPAASALNRAFIERFEAHEPVYFIAGDEDPLAKFQFSFKYRLATLIDAEPEGLPTTFQLGYTQRSLWDLDADSSPFYDTSYMPEFFFEKLGTIGDGRGRGGWLDWVGVQAGVRHESNGRDGDASRSLNVAYMRFAFHIGDPESWHMLVSPEVYYYITEIDDNPMLNRFRYYGSLELVFQRGDGISFSMTGRPGKDFDHLTYQLDLHIPIRIGLLDHESYFLIQYFDGYGESLLDYNIKTQSLRAGISLVR